MMAFALPCTLRYRYCPISFPWSRPSRADLSSFRVAKTTRRSRPVAQFRTAFRICVGYHGRGQERCAGRLRYLLQQHSNSAQFPGEPGYLAVQCADRQSQVSRPVWREESELVLLVRRAHRDRARQEFLPALLATGSRSATRANSCGTSRFTWTESICTRSRTGAP
jgi:hypothetical protein